jgi:hypothetical protein
MERDVAELRARLEAVTRELEQVQRRLDALEAGRETRGAEAAVALPDPSGETPAAEVERPALPVGASIIPLLGRTLMVLGGAYLLRAITGAAVVPASVGVAAGLAYAAWWLVQADRSAAAGRRLGAVFHGFAALAIAYPLIWETTVRFGHLAPSAAVASLVSFLGFGLVVAWRHDLWEIASSLTLVTLATTLGLLFSTHEFVVFTIALLLIASGVEALAFRDRWLGLRWPVALVLDLAVAMLAGAALRPDSAAEGSPAVPLAAAIAIALVLPALYIGSVGARTLLRPRPVTPFDVVQALAALAVGFGSALSVIAAADADPAPVGVASLVLGAACYVVAFASVDRSSGRGRNFYTYTTFAGVLVLVGTGLFLERSALALTWSALAVASVALGGRFDRITLRFHGALYVAAAAIVAGLIACAFDGLLADPGASWHPLTPVCMVVAVAAAACYGILVATPTRMGSSWRTRLPEAIVGAVLLWSAVGVAVGSLAGPLVAAVDEGLGRSAVAASRTGALALLAVGIAWAGRHWSLRELTWFVYPVLLGAGLKLLWEDFRVGQPLTLFVALGLYGGALIVTPRLMKTVPDRPDPA